jgi:hypothetical protein
MLNLILPAIYAADARDANWPRIGRQDHGAASRLLSVPHGWRPTSPPMMDELVALERNDGDGKVVTLSG